LPPAHQKRWLTFWEVNIANKLLPQVLKLILSIGGIRNTICYRVRRVFTLFVIDEGCHDLLSGGLGRGI
jgi:hypothetical protein